MGIQEKQRVASREFDVVSRFLPEADIVSIESLGEGNINESYLVVLSDHPAVVLQKINGEVFSDPEGVAVNGWLVSEHLGRKQAFRKEEGRLPKFISTREGKRYWLDSSGGVWRAQYFLRNTVTGDRISMVSAAYEGGKLLGGFHTDLADFPSEQLSVAIAGFHDISGYCSRYGAAEREFSGEMTADLAFCMKEVEKRLDKAMILEDAWRSGAVPRRLTHGDPKSSNMLLDSHSGRGVAMIDLDTVARGLPVHDIGDCLRSFCNLAGEAPVNSSGVVFDIDRCAAVLQGYADSGARLLKTERELVYQGLRLMTYELSVRFLTDYLEGNRYFRARHRLENLQRALTQMKLLHSIEKQKHVIEKLALHLFA